MPESITTAVIGLNCGSQKNASLTPIATAHITAIITSSRGCGFLLSNAAKKGSIR